MPDLFDDLIPDQKSLTPGRGANLGSGGPKAESSLPSKSTSPNHELLRPNVPDLLSKPYQNQSRNLKDPLQRGGTTKRGQSAMKLLQGMGYTKEGAGAIVGNLSLESGPNLDRGSNIAMFGGNRYKDLQNFAKSKGLNLLGEDRKHNLDTQLQFLDEELKTKYSDLYKKLHSSGGNVSQLTQDVETDYESPNRKRAHGKERKRLATEYGR